MNVSTGCNNPRSKSDWAKKSCIVGSRNAIAVVNPSAESRTFRAVLAAAVAGMWMSFSAGPIIGPGGKAGRLPGPIAAAAFPVSAPLPFLSRNVSRHTLTCSRFWRNSDAARFPFPLIEPNISRAASNDPISDGLPIGTKLDIARITADEKR